MTLAYEQHDRTSIGENAILLRASLRDYPTAFSDVAFDVIIKDDAISEYQGENDEDKP